MGSRRQRTLKALSQVTNVGQALLHNPVNGVFLDGCQSNKRAVVTKRKIGPILVRQAVDQVNSAFAERHHLESNSARVLTGEWRADLSRLVGRGPLRC